MRRIKIYEFLCIGKQFLEENGIEWAATPNGLDLFLYLSLSFSYFLFLDFKLKCNVPILNCSLE